LNIQAQEVFRTLSKHEQKRISSHHILIKIPKEQSKERILKAAKEKGQVTCKGKPRRIAAHFSAEILKAKRAWTDAFQVLKQNNCQPRLVVQ
jgi:hypothetical protein